MKRPQVKTCGTGCAVCRSRRKERKQSSCLRSGTNWRTVLAVLMIVLLFAPVAQAQWTHPSDTDDHINPVGTASEPFAAMDNNGNALIAWYQSDGSNDQIFKSEYRDGTWTHPTDTNDNISPDGQRAVEPLIAMDNSGNALIVWKQEDDSGIYQVFKSEYRDGAWTHPTDLSDHINIGGENCSHLGVAMDNCGNALIVWEQKDDGGIFSMIFKSEYRNGTWTHPSSLSDNISPDGSIAGGPEVAMDDNGNALIVWQQWDDSTTYQIFKSEYRDGAWTHPGSLSDNISPDGQKATSPGVVMGNNGNALIAWEQSDGSNSQIFLSEYRDGVWTHPNGLSDNISPDGQDAEEQRIAMDNSGNALIAWQQSDGSNDQVFLSEYRDGVWTHPSGLSDHISLDGTDAYFPQVAMDNSGNALSTWHQRDDSNVFQVFLREYRDGGWTNPSGLSDNIGFDGLSSTLRQVAMDDTGSALICWAFSSRIYKSEYSSPAKTPGITVTESGGATRVTEAETTDTVTVVLDSQPASDVMLSVTSADTGEATVSPSSLTFTNGNWSTVQTVTVRGVSDGVADGDQTTAITISVVDGSSDDAYDAVPNETVSVTTVELVEPRYLLWTK